MKTRIKPFFVLWIAFCIIVTTAFIALIWIFAEGGVGGHIILTSFGVHGGFTLLLLGIPEDS